MDQGGCNIGNKEQGSNPTAKTDGEGEEMTRNGPPESHQAGNVIKRNKHAPLINLAIALCYLVRIYHIRTKAIVRRHVRRWIGRAAYVISPSLDLVCIGIFLMWGWTIWYLSFRQH